MSEVAGADMVIGSLLLPGGRTPLLICRDAALGADKAVAELPPLPKALNLKAGRVLNKAVAEAQGL